MLVSVVVRIALDHGGASAFFYPKVVQLSVTSVVGYKFAVDKQVDILAEPYLMGAVFMAVPLFLAYLPVEPRVSVGITFSELPAAPLDLKI
jgi:hypothetical protein